MGHAKVTEHLQVVFRRVASALRSNLIHRAHECDEFARQNPVEVSIFNLLVILVLFVVEVAEVVPAETHREFESLETVKHGAAVGAVAVGGVAERPE